MRLIPDSHGLREYNHCHAPAGSPDGGQFCSGGSTARDETPSYGSSPHADTLRTLVTAMGYLAKEGRSAVFSSAHSGPSVRPFPKGVTLAQVKKAIAANPVVDGWRFTYVEPEVVRSKGGVGASKAGIRVDSNKRAKYLGAKVKVERDTVTVKDETPAYGGGSKKVTVRGLPRDIAAEVPPIDTLRWVETGWSEARQTMLATSDSEDDTLSPEVTRDISVNGTVTYRLQKDGYPKRKTLALALSDYARVRIGRRNERRVRDEAAK